MSDLNPIFESGTATVNQGGTTVTLSGATGLVTAGIRAGDQFKLAGLSVTITAAPTGNGTLSIKPYPGPSVSGGNYEILRVSDGARVTAASLELAAGIMGNVGPFASLPGAANKLPYFTGPGALGLADLTPYMRGLLATNSIAALQASLGLRERLAGHRTYYVAPGGSDTNSGLSPGAAFATINAAINVVAAGLDLGPWNVTIQLADGLYQSAAVTLRSYITSGGAVRIVGNNTSPQNVVIQTTGHGIQSYWTYATYHLIGFTLRPSLGGYWGIDVSTCRIFLGAIRFDGTSPQWRGHIRAQTGAIISDMSSPDNWYTIAGSVDWSHVYVDNARFTIIYGSTVNLIGTPSLGNVFDVRANGTILIASTTVFSGAATGRRYRAAVNGTIETQGSGPNFLPGDIAGDALTGGQYV